MKKSIFFLSAFFYPACVWADTVTIDADQWLDLQTRLDNLQTQVAALDMTGIMYVFIGIMAAWAIIAGIQALNS